MNTAIPLAALVSVTFLALGAAKILALTPVRALAAHAGFSVQAYRGIGTLEVAGAVGVALGPVAAPLGVLAGAGLLILLAGAVVTHLRNGDGIDKAAPAVICALLVIGYLAALLGATS
jgi:hypothetical protein